MSMELKSRRALHAADTRQALLTGARRCFARHGYAATSLDEICERARVTKGALYHHFAGKEDLFLAVYDDLGQELVRFGAAAADGIDDQWQQLRVAGQAYLKVCARPDVRAIILEAPVVLGWERCRQIDRQYSLGQLEAALEAAVAAGMVTSASPARLAELLAAMFSEAAMAVAASGGSDDAREEVGRELDLLLAALRR
jgi:AcrR family transcriptional regulator